MSEVILSIIHGSLHVPNGNRASFPEFFTLHSLHTAFYLLPTAIPRHFCIANAYRAVRSSIGICVTSVVKKTTRRILAGSVSYKPEREELQFDTKNSRLL